jgi:hypothetical protein
VGAWLLLFISIRNHSSGNFEIRTHLLPETNTVAFLPHDNVTLGIKRKVQITRLRSACSNHSSRDIVMHAHMLTAIIAGGYPEYTDVHETEIIDSRFKISP